MDSFITSPRLPVNFNPFFFYLFEDKLDSIYNKAPPCPLYAKP